MSRAKLICRLLWVVVFLAPSFMGCALLYRNGITLKRSDFGPMIEQLVNANPSYFKRSSTLVVMLDRAACGSRLLESEQWSEWRQHMQEINIGFVFATSQADSAGLVFAAQLDSAEAPVLVLSSYEQSFKEMGIPRGVTPLHFLVDSTAAILMMLTSAYDIGEDWSMMSAVDSFVINTGASKYSNSSGKAP